MKTSLLAVRRRAGNALAGSLLTADTSFWSFFRSNPRKQKQNRAMFLPGKNWSSLQSQGHAAAEHILNLNLKIKSEDIRYFIEIYSEDELFTSITSRNIRVIANESDARESLLMPLLNI